MLYFMPFKVRDNIILSCDMLRLSFTINDFGFQNITNFLNEYDFNHKLSFTYFESRKLFNYRHLFDIQILENHSSFALGLCFNSLKKKNYYKCFIEFNPNKTLSFDISPLFNLLNVIRSNCSLIELVRFDLAIDFPCKRSLLSLLKDLRDFYKVYRVENHSLSSEDVTEYLGKRNVNGFVKLYNKGVESNLNYDLTRLELTLDNFNYDNFISVFPKLYYFKNIDIFTLNELNDTDKVLFALLSESPNKNLYLSLLGRVKQEKMKKLLYNISDFSVTLNEFLSVVNNIRSLYV